MTQYIIQSKGKYNGKPVEVSSNVKAITILDALKAYLEKTGQHKIETQTLSLTDVKDS
jgi:hypothetical protein